jgi:hypothetical protein
MPVADNLGAVQMWTALIALLALVARWSGGDFLGGVPLDGISLSFLAIAGFACLVTLVVAPTVTGR